LKRKVATFYWMQLLALAGVHFIIDMFAGMPPAILPAIRSEFALSLSWGGLILGVFYITCNGIQPLSGHMRANERRPLFLHIGLIVGACICLLGALPRGGSAFPAMILLAVISGGGIAIVHPEALRAVHRLRVIPPATSTAVFMAGGFLGYASGGAVSAFLVSRFGLQGLYPLIFCPVVVIVIVSLLKVRLAVERKRPGKARTQTETGGLPFWLILAMAMPAAVSTTVLASLLPTVLEELDFELTFGGLSATVFGLGGAVGSFFWASIAHKKGELGCSIAALFLAIPFLTAYLVLIDNGTAIWILFGVGFCTIAAYTLMITLSRYATGLALGQRMGFMVGGTWALAYIVFMALLPAAEHFGSDTILRLTPLGYLLSGLFGVFLMLKTQASNRAKSSVEQAVTRN
jgi:FSR family fosmidomycin resistance protein-like MFS transporter